MDVLVPTRVSSRTSLTLESLPPSSNSRTKGQFFLHPRINDEDKDLFPRSQKILMDESKTFKESLNFSRNSGKIFETPRINFFFKYSRGFLWIIFFPRTRIPRPLVYGNPSANHSDSFVSRSLGKSNALCHFWNTNGAFPPPAKFIPTLNHLPLICRVASHRFFWCLLT